MSAPQSDDKAFYTPREVTKVTGLSYKTVLEQIHDGRIPSEKFGTIYKVPSRWIRENRGDKQQVLHIAPPPVPAAAPDYGPLASVLEILGTAMVQAAGALRGSV